jgi:hypothetical protein
LSGDSAILLTQARRANVGVSHGRMSVDCEPACHRPSDPGPVRSIDAPAYLDAYRQNSVSRMQVLAGAR